MNSPVPYDLDGCHNMDDPLHWLVAARAGGHVQRYHANRVAAQSVAAHSWGVAVLVLLVWPRASAALLRTALMHDVSEAMTGDIPYPAKATFPELRALEHEISEAFNVSMGINSDLDEFEYKVLKWCDMFECMVFCCEQMRTGNLYAARVMRTALDALYAVDFPGATGMYAQDSLDTMDQLMAGYEDEYALHTATRHTHAIDGTNVYPAKEHAA